MFKKEDNGIYQFNKLLEFGNLAHGISTSEFGNMSLSRGRRSEVLKNRKKFLEVLGIGNYNIPMNEQVHSNNVKVIDSQNVFVPSKVDGLVTGESHVALILFAGDCYPALFYDPIKKVMGMAHIGWRGAKGKIVQRVLYALKEEFGSRAWDIHVGIGPGICADCYRFEHRREFDSEWDKYLEADNTGKYKMDFLSFAIKDLLSMGINRNKIYLSNVCTRENSSEFYSQHAFKRGETSKNFRFAAVMALKHE